MSKMLIFVPTTGMVYSEHMRSCLGLKKVMPTTWAVSQNSLVYDARNMAAKMAIQGGFDYLLFIDSDMIVPPEIIEKLIAHDKDVVSGFYFKRVYPFLPVAYDKFNIVGGELQHHYLDKWSGDLIKVDAIGMGCCLIKTKVLDDIKSNWFDTMANIGEDQAFCIRARERGYDIYLDTNLIVPHIGTQNIIDQHYFIVQNSIGGDDRIAV